MASPSVVVAEGVRTPMAEYNGLFADMTATDLAVHRLDELQPATLAKWFAQQAGEPQRRTAHIKLYDANFGNQSPIATWTLEGAWPVQYTGPTLSTTQEGEAVAVETLELSHQGFAA